MPYFVHDGQLIYFCHVPKTGGSSIERWLESCYGEIEFLDDDWTNRWKRGGWLRDRIGSSRQHMTWDKAQDHLPRLPDHVFAVVRAPRTRLESEYRFQLRHRRKRRAVAGLGFSRWLRVMYAAHRFYPGVLDNHVRPQVSFIPDDAKVFRFEDGLDCVVEWVARIAPSSGGTVPLPGPDPKSSREAIPRLAEDDALIAELYAEDFARFGYDASAKGPFSIGIRNRLLGALVAFAFRIGRF
ncbi:sulfotransferase family 2 domain-containing protein [Rhodobacterales bacterium HKCCE2091]|nr:sulfotransferase family 2 domain-containing protein [Rhodobacterales bacterium HKCCE2091]